MLVKFKYLALYALVDDNSVAKDVFVVKKFGAQGGTHFCNTRLSLVTIMTSRELLTTRVLAGSGWQCGRALRDPQTKKHLTPLQPAREKWPVVTIPTFNFWLYLVYQSFVFSEGRLIVVRTR